LCHEINRCCGYGRASNRKSNKIYSQGIICIILIYNNNHGSVNSSTKIFKQACEQTHILYTQLQTLITKQ
jgi:hypothetical protein